MASQKKNNHTEKHPLDFSEQIAELEALLDDEDDDFKRALLNGLLHQYRLDLQDIWREEDKKSERFPVIPPPPSRSPNAVTIRETGDISTYFREHPNEPIKIVRGTKTIRELLTRMDKYDLYNFCKYVQRYDVLLTNSTEKWIDAIHEAYFKDPVALLYPADPDQMDDVLSLPQLADQGKGYTGKELTFMPLCCLASFDVKTATLTLASDYEELFSKVTPVKLERAKKRVSEFDPAIDVLMHHFGLIEMVEVPNLLQQIFQIKMSEKLCFSLIYFRLSIPDKYQTLTLLTNGRPYIAEKGLDLKRILLELETAGLLVPYWLPTEFELDQWKRKKSYIDAYPGWSYLLGMFVVNTGMELEEAKKLCDQYYMDVRNGAKLNEVMADLMGTKKENHMLIPRMVIWETCLHFLLGTALPGLKGANRIVTSQIPGYMMTFAFFVDDPVKEDMIKPDTHIEKMPEDIQRELGSRLFTLEESDLEPIKAILDKYKDNIDLNYIYGVANERLGHLPEAVKAFEKVDQMLNGTDPTLEITLRVCRDGKIRKPACITSDGAMIL